MEKKRDLSNLVSKKVDHQSKRHTPPHHFNTNRTNTINAGNEEISEREKNIDEQENNSLAGFGGNIGTNRNSNISNSDNLIIKMPIKMKVGLMIFAVIIPLIFLMLFVVLFSGDGKKNFGGRIAFGDVYNMKCNEMTVIFVDPKNGYEVTGSQTYSMTDYVAGVVSAEVGGFANKEVYKVYALAARTFGLTASSDDCTIEGSARRQAFNDITNSSGKAVEMIYEAVRETEGQVLLSNGELYRLQYDAFCYVDKDENYYTLSQKNQKIPVEWAKKTVWSKHYLNCPCDLKDPNMTECWSNGVWQDGGHGRGMSQYGAYYLATEQGYTYDQILDYYFGDDGVTISSNSFNLTSIAGLEIKDTTNATSLNQPITEFLNSKGSSLEDMNNYIHNSVVDQGAGTRAGVVTAAVSMINYLYDNFNTKLPYYWGGKIYSGSQIPATFGKYSPSSVTGNGNRNYYISFDCSGFVSWTIRAGGYNFSPQSTQGFASNFYKNSCDITENDCIGQPGDLINYRNYSNTAGHVLLILAVDEENGKYFVAHSGGKGVVMEQRDMHAKEVNDGITKIVFMEEYYTNPSNIDNSY